MDNQKAREERIKELLDAPALEAASAIKGPSLGDLVQDEPKQDDDSVNEDESPKDKKIRIRASRLTKLEEELEASRQERQKDLDRIAALEKQLKNDQEDDMPDWWKEAYGDNEVSRRGYQSQLRVHKEILEKELAERESQRHEQEAVRAERLEAIEQSFDDQMESLEEDLGRDLTDNQKAEILDIVESESEAYKDEDGKYSTYIPISTAYRIWSAGSSRNQGKQEMARIAGSQSSGLSSVQSSPDRPQWGDWRKKYNL